MVQNVLGIEMDATRIRVAQVVRKGRNIKVVKFAFTPLEPGIIVDGRVNDIQLLTNALENLVQEQDLEGCSAVLGLRSSWITVKTHRLPLMSQRELDKGLEFEIPSLVSFPITSVQDICYDYFINSKTEQEVELVIVAAPRKQLDPYIESLKRTGLSLTSIDLTAFGWSGLLADQKRRAFVEISEEQTTIFVNSVGVYKVLRMVPLGERQFVEGIKEAFGCSEREVRSLYMKHDLDYLLLEGEGNKRVLRATVQQFVGSILQTLDFVRAQERATQFRSMLDEMILIGDFADVAGMASMLQKELDVPVTTLKQISNLSVDFDVIRPGRFNCFGSALAMALRGIKG